MKFTVVGTLADNPESQMYYHVDVAHKGEAIEVAQNECRQGLVDDGSLELDEDPENWEPDEQEPLNVAGVFPGFLHPL